MFIDSIKSRVDLAQQKEALETHIPTSVQSSLQAFIYDAFEQAASLLSPAWDIRDYIAVNPFWGIKDRAFLEGVSLIQAASGKALLPSKAFFREQFETSKILKSDLSFALKQIQAEPGHADAYHVNILIDNLKKPSQQPVLQLKCLSDMYDTLHGSHLTDIFTRETSKWMTAYFDEGQALWAMPGKEQGLYLAWKYLAKYDRHLNKYGLKLGALVHHLPDDSREALTFLTRKILEQVDLNQKELMHYFFRLFCSVNGWASYLKKFDFEAQRSGQKALLEHMGSLLDVLVIRMVYDILILKKMKIPEAFKSQLTLAKSSLNQSKIEYIWLLALEHAYRRQFIHQVKASKLSKPFQYQKPRAQLVFCIDVRSERIRRAIETCLPEIQTIGFAGFFGMPASYKGLGHRGSDQNCPILINPQFSVEETAPSHLFLKKWKQVRRIALQKKLQLSTHAGFNFVETLGWSYIYKMISHSLGKSSPNLDVYGLGLTASEKRQIKLTLKNLDLDTQISMAAEALKGMGLKDQFADLVIFFGHASTSTNNPYASALDCGACAGHSGMINAQVLAQLLNNQEIRQALLKQKEITIPESTVFLAGLHNTTLDSLEIDIHQTELTEGQQTELGLLQHEFEKAKNICRSERSQYLSFCEAEEKQNLETSLQTKALDWSEIRPEWGLAGNASFMIARRETTRGLNLEGRAFLHDYDAEKDTEGDLLEQIMTAPMVVTNWINMQYYASTVAPTYFGSGNKVLHNVVGHIGCVSGNAGDLLLGLSEQSVHYQGKYFHHPMRLQVFIEASSQKIASIIEKHQVLKALVHNEWLQVIAMDPKLQKFEFYTSKKWLTV